MNRGIISFLAMIMFGLPSFSLSQTTTQQIDSLRKVGEREGWTFTVGMTDASRYSLEQLCGMKKPDQLPTGTSVMPALTSSAMNFPSYFDWRELGGVTPIRNQGSCGSCWAFATVGALECNLKIRDGITVDLSEQWLVSCNNSGFGCDGGWWAHDYHLPLSHPEVRFDDCGDNAPVFEADFPYTASDDPCDCPYPHQYDLCINDWGYISEELIVAPVDDIKRAIMMYGPVSVSVYVNAAFQNYTGGVFNACSDEEINHAIVLVGWDDTLGANGCWILRNSWGTNWGENGYMYIEYGCSRVGYGACYVDCGLPSSMDFWGDSLYGYVPHTVNFEAYYPDPVDTWSWSFGDGGTDNVESPGHTYNERGSFDVTLEVVSGGELHSVTKEMYIVAIADTLKTTSEAGLPGEQVVLTLSTFNSAPTEYFKIPVEFANDFNLRYDSFSTVGCRTDYFERQDYLHYDIWFGRRFTLRLISSQTETSPDLPVGEGPIVKLFFTIPVTAIEGNTAAILIDGYDAYLPQYSGDWATYTVPAISGSIIVSDYCCSLRGDIDHSGSLDGLDITYFVNWMWKSSPELPCEDEAEVNGDGAVDPLDLTYLVDYFWKSGPAPVSCE
ncbi:MAG: C1 family peptidase [Candidatus Zixiibacteriota bacterium]